MTIERKYISNKKPISNGFTLIEMVVAIVIASVLAMGTVSFIADTVNGYTSSAARNKLATSGRSALDRMALELNNAIPNSIRVTTPNALTGNQCLEFVPFIGATTYINPGFSGSGNDAFQVIDFNPMPAMGPVTDLYAAIYPINTADLYNYNDNVGPLALIDELENTGGNDGRITIHLDAQHRFSRRSPIQRIFLVQEPVSFCVVEDKLYRYRNYGFRATQCNTSTLACLPTAAPDRRLITDSISNAGLTAFTYNPPSLRRNAITSFNLNLVSGNDVANLSHEVLMRNVP